MSLALTPINEAWNSVKPKPKPKPKFKQQQKMKPNIYNNPETQSKILSELGMIPQNDIEYEVQEVEEPKQIEIHNPNSLNINLKNIELVNMLKPYSNDYIETILLGCIKNQQQTGITKELVDTIETMYMMISLILLLLVIDLLFKMKRN